MKTTTICPPHFQNAVVFANVHGMYMGTGNPNAQLLMIGKEAAISMETNEEQYKREISNNSQDWLSNIQNNSQLEDVPSWFDQKPPVYNPLYPYKNQKNLVESRNKFGNIIRGNGGTSKTWHNYQQFCDAIYNDGRKSALINFHEHFFCTELNEMTGKYSKDVKRNERLVSIQHRKFLLEQPYFQIFPITIVAVGHYVRDFNIDLESLFDV